MSRSTIQDVARLAGVSAGTVSRVTHNHPAVDPQLRSRVLAAIDSLQYQPSLVAQSLRMASTRLVGCLLSDIGNPFYAVVLQAAEAVFAPAGYTLLIASTGNKVEREIDLLHAFASRGVDGLIAVPAAEQDSGLLQAYRGLTMPLVVMERDMPLHADTVLADHGSGMEAATTYLLGLGHKRVALITGGPTTRTGRARIRGYRDALTAGSVKHDPALLHVGGLRLVDGAAAMAQLLGLQEPPTAVIAAGNHLLAGVLRVLAQAKKAVPKDISVLSAGDSELAELAATPVGVIRWDLAAFGLTVAEQLLGRIAEPKLPPRRTVLPTELVVRESCARPAGEGWL
jgi:LacI family transcriptional regulator